MSIITTDYGLIKPPPGCQLDYGHPINRGLVGCWLFNEKNGTRLTDYSGYNNHGTLTNFAMTGSTSNWVGSPFGGSLYFDGSNDYINVGTGRTSLFFLTTNAFSGSAWIYFTSVNPRVFCNWNLNVGAGWNFSMGDFVNQKMTLIFGSATGASYFARDITTALSFNKLYHVAFTYNGSGANTGINLYVNGVLQEMTNRSSGTVGTLIDNGFVMGKRDVSGSPQAGTVLSGYLDIARMFNRVLTATEISQLYSQPNIGILSPTYYTPS